MEGGRGRAEHSGAKSKFLQKQGIPGAMRDPHDRLVQPRLSGGQREALQNEPFESEVAGAPNIFLSSLPLFLPILLLLQGKERDHF